MAPSPTMSTDGRLPEHGRGIPHLRIGMELPDTEAEGPGRRYAVWLQGCPLRCPSCCNPEFLPFEGGADVAVPSLLERIVRQPDIEGVSILGGEPFAQPKAVAELCERVQQAGLSVVLFSGYELHELRAMNADSVNRILAACDLLIDGPFVHTRPERQRRWIGSSNQVMHFLSERYDPDDGRFVEANTIELRMTRDGTMLANGHPASLTGLLHGRKP